MIYFQLIITQLLVWTQHHAQREHQQSTMNSAQGRLQGPCFSYLQIILFNLLTFILKLRLKINVQRVKNSSCVNERIHPEVVLKM